MLAKILTLLDHCVFTALLLPSTIAGSSIRSGSESGAIDWESLVKEHSSSPVVDDEDLTLHIALHQSWIHIGGSSSSATFPVAWWGSCSSALTRGRTSRSVPSLVMKWGD